MDDFLNNRIKQVVRHGPVVFGLLVCLVAALLYLNIPEEPTYWKNYSDSWDYLHQSEMPFFSSDFFFCPYEFTERIIRIADNICFVFIRNDFYVTLKLQKKTNILSVINQLFK